MIRKARSDKFAPTKEIAVERCEVCGIEASFGLGWPASDRERWLCRAHVPAGFFPADRKEMAA